MAFAAVNCQTEVDELALIQWRATRLAGVLAALDFPGQIPSKGEVGSGDSLIHTHAPGRGGAVRDGHRRAGLSQPHSADQARRATAGQALAKAMSVLEEAAKDVRLTNSRRADREN